MSTRTFNILFNVKHCFELRDTSPDIYHHSRTLQKLIKDVVKVGVEDVIYTLQFLSVWGFINGSITHDAIATGDQTKWITIDKRVCGIIANTLNDSLLHNVSYDYASTAIGAPFHPYIAKAIWDKMATLFGF